MRRLICATLALASAGALAGERNSNVRFWTDNTGDFTVSGELTSSDRDSITLLLSDGDRVRVPLRRLSSADRAWLRLEGYSHQPSSTEISGIEWFADLKDAQAIAAGSNRTADDKPIMCFRALGDLSGFM